MLRLVFMIFLSWWCIEVAGQSVTIPKSTDIVVLRGKSYYLHTVQPGQTLYSICKAYGVNLEEVKVLNGKKENELSLYEVLKVPYIEPFIQQDGKYYYHKVVKGETLYSIARHYDIKPKRLLKHNAEFTDKPLAVGTVIRLPLNEIDQSVLKSREVEITEKITVEQSEGNEQTPGDEGNEQIEIHPASAAEEKTGVKDTLPIPAKETTYIQEKREMPDYISEVIMPGNPFVKVALLLPFSAGDYPWYTDTLGGSLSVNISARSEQFIGFYEGVLLAVDSLKNQGYKIDLHVFDTERSSEKAFLLAEEINRLNPDLIIGPVYGSVYKGIADNLINKEIPLVYPLSSRSESFGEYPNFVQVNASFGAVASKMIEWLGVQRRNANLVHIQVAGGDETEMAEKRYLKELLMRLEGVHSFNWDMEQVPLDSLRTLLLPDRENILVFPDTREANVSKILPFLSALTDGYQITVVGLPEWQTFGSVDHETFYKLNTKLFSYSYVDYSSSAAQALAQKYRKFFYTEPGSLVYKAFDMGLYFIEMAAKYRDRMLAAIEYDDRSTAFSRFRFEKIPNGLGKENHGFYIIHFGSDYHLRIETPEN